MDLHDRVMASQEPFKEDFFEEGYQGNVRSIFPFLPFPEDRRVSPYSALVESYIAGYQKRLSEEHDLFERGYLLLMHHEAFLPIKLPEDANEELEFQIELDTIRDEFLIEHPEVEAEHKKLGVDYDELYSSTLLQKAGIHILYALRQEMEIPDIAERFKRLLDGVIETGKTPMQHHTEIDTIEALKAVAQDPTKFILRYQQMYQN